ncbi:MAG: hypothetical protein Q9228_005391 [Teloschistes exilis]
MTLLQNHAGHDLADIYSPSPSGSPVHPEQPHPGSLQGREVPHHFTRIQIPFTETSQKASMLFMFFDKSDPPYPLTEEDFFIVVYIRGKHYAIRRITDTILYLRALVCLAEKRHHAPVPFRQHIEEITDARIEVAFKTDATPIIDEDYALEKPYASRLKEAEGVERARDPVKMMIQEIRYMLQDEAKAVELINVFRETKEALDAEREREDKEQEGEEEEKDG